MKVKKLRVDVVSLRKKLEIILKMLVDTEVISTYRSVFKGKGLEFEDYRAYTTDDDAKQIDWRASKRAGQLIIKLFKEERELDVFIILDTSDSMIFGSTEKLKMEYAAEVAAAFAFMIIESGDKTGVIMFSDKINRMIPAGIGKRQFQIILSNLTKPENYAGGFDLIKAMDFVIKTSTKKGLMIIISDFIGLDEKWEKKLRLASVKFDVIGVMIRDPRDDSLPKENLGQFVLQDPYSEASILVDPTKITEAYEDYAKKEVRRIQESFSKSKAELIKLSTDKPFIKPLIEYFIMRRSRTWR